MGGVVNIASTPAASLYVARVSHRRRIPPRYRFVYRLFYFLIDIDRIDEAANGLRLFSRNRFNVLALHDRDHGDGTGTPLRKWAEILLRQRDIELDGGRIRLLCIPRLLGFAFNPISLWYCEHADGSLRAVIAEVRNTFGEKHCYVLASGGGPLTYEQAWDKDKCFHVSPFFDLVGRYRFLMTRPDERLRVVIHETREGRPILDATLAGERRELRDGTILRQVLRMPGTTLKVVAAIHWEALKIWLRGARFHRKPPPPEHGVS
ncbi:MAG: hypothetical protein K0Q76_1672 [Panacagrimonas sp.]|jgi:DUF1365 family protein|nr:DUF1365 domain-containing protein [Panacagrimonas sp.]MCC2656564.1 hypothetical protein [Panacagrimonas sp.]